MLEHHECSGDMPPDHKLAVRSRGQPAKSFRLLHRDNDCFLQHIMLVCARISCDTSTRNTADEAAPTVPFHSYSFVRPFVEPIITISQ